MESEFSAVEPKRKRPDTNYAACLICQHTDSNAGPLQKLTDQGYPALLYAVTNRKDDVSFRLVNKLEPQFEFLKRNPVWHTRCRAGCIPVRRSPFQRSCFQRCYLSDGRFQLNNLSDKQFKRFSLCIVKL